MRPLEGKVSAESRSQDGTRQCEAKARTLTGPGPEASPIGEIEWRGRPGARLAMWWVGFEPDVGLPVRTSSASSLVRRDAPRGSSRHSTGRPSATHPSVPPATFTTCWRPSMCSF